MTRQRFEGLRMEMVRRTLVMFDKEKANKVGKVLAHLRDTKIDWAKCRELGMDSYKDIWNSCGFVELRKSVGMYNEESEE